MMTLKKWIRKWLGIEDDSKTLVEVQDALNNVLMSNESEDTQVAVNYLLMNKKGE